MNLGCKFLKKLVLLQWESITFCPDEGLTLETSAFKLFTLANLYFQLS